MEEKYFVGSNGEEPEIIYFNYTVAMNSEHAFIDSFDEFGRHVQAYKKDGERGYTREF